MATTRPTDASTEAWDRVAAELRRRNRNMTWLSGKLGCGVARVFNWSRRGLPASAYPEVAEALQVSIDWLAGAGSAPNEGRRLSPMALKLAAQFDAIDDDAAQLTAFVQIIGLLAKWSDGPSAPPTAPPAPGPNAGPRRVK